MRLTVHTDYALRLLMLLAMEPDHLHTIEQVAQRYRISRNHLMKVAQTLVQAGFIHSLRGRGGGLSLARSAHEISLGAVVRATEDNFALVACLDGDRSSCVISPACGLPGPLAEALQAFLQVLDGYSLADMIKSPGRARRIRGLLGGVPVTS
jgi:Rrf2 family nitric oxide-sensitive transcriptional repressor